MAYLNYQNHNIQFNKVTQPSFTTSGRISRARYQVDNDNNIINYNNTTINAIDIDWNGAYLESLDTYINSTGDLLYQINFIYDSLTHINQPDLSNYLTHDDLTVSSLRELLDTVYANKSIETTISELSSLIANKANTSDIPKSIYNLDDYDDFAEKTWVNNLLRTYQKSAYDVYVENGGTLSKTEWLASLKGADGTNGKSAFEIAKQYDANLLNKTEEEWVESLKGQKGDKGDKGDTGPGINILGYYPSLSALYNATNDTINGIGDAYNVNGIIYVYNDLYNSSTDPISEKWKSAGQFKGDKGDDGKSAYDIYVEVQEALGNTPLNQNDWLLSLKGDRGEQGKSAYDIYVEVQEALGNTPLSKSDWLNSIGGIEYSAGNHISISENHVISVINRQSNEVWVDINS